MEKLCILLLLMTAEAQILFPDASLITDVSPSPVVIKSFQSDNTSPADDSKIYFPDDPVARAPTTTTRPSGGVFQEERIHIINPGPSPGPSPVLSPGPSLRPSLKPSPSSSHSSNLSHIHNSPSDLSVIPSECGKSFFTSRVVGGRVSEPGEWPWLAAVGTKRGSRFISTCGGTLITVRHVLSAQHCFNNPSKPSTVRLGEYDLKRSDDVPDTQDFDIVQHYSRRYNPGTYENDIVILVLDRDVVFSDYIQAVCLPFNERDNDFAGETLVVAGWGKTDYETASYSNVPLDANVPVVDNRRCAQSYHRLRGNIRPVIDERSLCAGDGTKDSCNGDSGGPLQYLSLSDGRYYLVGIVSFGLECANIDYPGVYTRVTSFLDWIVNNVQ